MSPLSPVPRESRFPAPVGRPVLDPWQPEGEERSRSADYLQILQRRKGIFALVALLVFSLGAFAVSLRTPKYVASATLRIEPEPPKVIDIQSVVAMILLAQPIGHIDELDFRRAAQSRKNRLCQLNPGARNP